MAVERVTVSELVATFPKKLKDGIVTEFGDKMIDCIVLLTPVYGTSWDTPITTAVFLVSVPQDGAHGID